MTQGTAESSTTPWDEKSQKLYSSRNVLKRNLQNVTIVLFYILKKYDIREWCKRERPGDMVDELRVRNCREIF